MDQLNGTSIDTFRLGRSRQYFRYVAMRLGFGVKTDVKIMNASCKCKWSFIDRHSLARVDDTLAWHRRRWHLRASVNNSIAARQHTRRIGTPSIIEYPILLIVIGSKTIRQILRLSSYDVSVAGPLWSRVERHCSNEAAVLENAQLAKSFSRDLWLEGSTIYYYQYTGQDALWNKSTTKGSLGGLHYWTSLTNGL